VSSYIGIDPGKTGGIACVEVVPDTVTAYVNRVSVTTLKLSEATEADVFTWVALRLAFNKGISWAVIEKVSSSPQMGVCSAFTFGRSYGFLRGVLAGAQVPFVEVSPQRWQKELGCMSKGDKNVTKAKAQQLYPGEKITHATADALLLATYCRQNHSQLF
jgi:hypothetical protein